MTIPLLKAYYGNIFFEFLVHKGPKDTIIILPGFPESNKDLELRFLYNKGYNVFYPRYKGSYQSGGEFLKTNIVHDLCNFLNELKKERAVNLWNLNEVSFKINKIILLGGSFSGAVSCGLVARSQNFSKLILVAPVWNFKRHNENRNEQDLQTVLPFIKRAYKNLYRIKFNDLVEQLSNVEELDPDYYVPGVNIPILVFHDPEDSNVSISHSEYMISKIKNMKLIKTHLGHSLSCKLLEDYWLEIEKFLTT